MSLIEDIIKEEEKKPKKRSKKKVVLDKFKKKGKLVGKRTLKTAERLQRVKFKVRKGKIPKSFKIEL